MPLSASSTLDTSTVQYRVSVKVERVVWLESVLKLLGWLPGGVRATSAYDGLGLDSWMLDSYFSTVAVTCC
jgi:hypothetical protein